MQYFQYWEYSFISLQPGWIEHFDEYIQITYGKIDKYTPRDWRKYTERTDVGYNDSNNQGLLEGHNNGWDEAKEYYQRIFGNELRAAKQEWKEGKNQYDDSKEESSEELRDSAIEDDVDWESYGQKDDLKQTESQEWFWEIPNDVLRDAIELRSCSESRYEKYCFRSLGCHF